MAQYGRFYWFTRYRGFTLRFLPGCILGFLLGVWATTGGAGAAKGPKKLKDKEKGDRAAADGPCQEELKMVLCVNQDLKMSNGKVGAQCAHAAVGCVTAFQLKFPAWFKLWRRMGEKKIALKVDDTAALLTLASQAQQAGLPYYVVTDAGRTQIAAGSRTVLAIGPAPDSRVNAITGGLRLL